MLEIRKLYNTKDKSKILIVNRIIGRFALGFNMLNETFVKVPLAELESTELNIFNYVPTRNKTALALLATYFNDNKIQIVEICSMIGISERTLYRYMNELNHNENN